MVLLAQKAPDIKCQCGNQYLGVYRPWILWLTWVVIMNLAIEMKGII